MQVAILAAMLPELAPFEPQLTATNELHFDTLPADAAALAASSAAALAAAAIAASGPRL
jgi:hypothetical protein